jgi:two-component system response regulator HydG
MTLPNTPIPLLYIDDEIEILQLYKEELSRYGFEITTAQSVEEGLLLLSRKSFPLILLDMKMKGELSGIDALKEIKRRWPLSEILVYTGYGDMDMAISALRSGAYHFLNKPLKLEELEIQLKQAYEKFSIHKENQIFKRMQEWNNPAPQLISHSPVFKKVFHNIEKVAPTDSCVLIEGERGTGKELLAREIHWRSPRAPYPFVVAHCSGLNEKILEKELLGSRSLLDYEHKMGFFEIAQEGTLFFDEIGDLPSSIQVLLLRILQSQQVKPLGSPEILSVNVRVLAATSRDLEALVAEERFRGDLYYHLKVIPLAIPPLRERQEDIPLLVEYFMKKFKSGRKGPQSFSSEALKALMDHSWPGNIRELANTIERLMTLSEASEITLEELKAGILPTIRSAETSSFPSLLSLRSLEEHHILKVLDCCGGNKTKAAKILGITSKTLYNKLAEFKQHEKIL